MYDLNSGGDWTLRIIDQYPVDTGTLKFLELELCLAGEIKSNTDGDLIPNDEDNCPFVTNPDQADLIIMGWGIYATYMTKGISKFLKRMLHAVKNKMVKYKYLR